MKKIGLMTWFTYDNYGSLLQCKAMLEIIKILGYDSELVNYEPRTPYKSNRTVLEFGNQIIKKGYKKIFVRKKKKIFQSKKMAIFRDELEKSKEVNTKSELFILNDVYDAFVCGSDQIWAPTAYDENYFLSFVRDNNKKIAYAPSIGLPVIENNFIKEHMKNLISQFQFLSTREDQGAKLIYQLTGRDAKVVLDPTLLLTKQEWEPNIAGISHKDYILTYFLGENKKHRKICKEIAKKLNKKLLIIPSNPCDYEDKDCIHDDIGPKEFLGLIDHSYMVLTDSFHGTIFSLNFKKPVIPFKRFKDDNMSQNSRIYNILNSLNLNNLLFEDDIDKSIECALSVDYKEVDRLLNSLRKSSIEYLKNSLEQATTISKKNSYKMITNNCTGCGVCAIICPKKCIEIKLNDKGFYEYFIDHEKCIHCNLCSKVCAQSNWQDDIKKIPKSRLYSAYCTDNKLLKKATSGGICSTIANEEIENKNSVIGCVYDSKVNKALMELIDSRNHLDKMVGSKYIQAYTLDAYKKIKNLKSGVIFGTPCQIASLNLYLNYLNKRDNFLLVDFICHGVPSYLLWDKYIHTFNNVKDVNFRKKDKGWHNKHMFIISSNSKYIIPESKDNFYHFFNVGNIYNECCYECRYRTSSEADIRVGDYWGERFKHNEQGVSMVIPLTQKGTEYMKFLKKNDLIHMQEENIEDYFINQQTNNYRIPLYYDKLMSELRDKNILLNVIDKKYNAKELQRRKIRKIIYKLKER